MSKDSGLTKELEGLTDDQLEYVRALIEVILRERDGLPVEDRDQAPSSGEVWGKIVSSLQTEGREAIELVVRTPFQEVVVLEIKLMGPRPVRQ